MLKEVFKFDKIRYTLQTLFSANKIKEQPCPVLPREGSVTSFEDIHLEKDFDEIRENDS